MYVKSAQLTFRLPHAASLKDKRAVARGMLDRVRNKFNVSVAEVAYHDAHQMLGVGLSLVAASQGHGQACFDEVVRFMDDYAEGQGAELVEEEMW